MTMPGAPQNKSGWRGWVTVVATVLALFTGLCTLFASVVTAQQAWEEHTQAQWPEVVAQVQRCGLDLYTYKPHAYWINCSISYQVRGVEITSRVHSRSFRAPSGIVWESSPASARLKQWVDAHSQGTQIPVHYDLANPQKAVLSATTDMPLAGPRTPDNLKLLGFFGVSFIVMLTLARIAWPRPAALEAYARN
jgi:hypothetical protein